MAWAQDWANMGAGLGELRADVREYIDDLFEAVTERRYAAASSNPSPDWPLNSGGSPTDDSYPLKELYAGNEPRTYNLREDLGSGGEATISNERRCQAIQAGIDRIVTANGNNGGASDFLNHTDSGGNWAGSSSFPPYWTEATILADIGDATRWKFPTPAGGELYAWGENVSAVDTDWPGLRTWLKQQYEICNRLLWTPRDIFWARDHGLSTEGERRRYGTTPTYGTEAAVIADVAANWPATVAIPMPNLDPNTRPSSSYYGNSFSSGTNFNAQTNTYVFYDSCLTPSSMAYPSAEVDFYIICRAPTEPNLGSPIVAVYDSNGQPGIPATANVYSKTYADVVKAALATKTYAPAATGGHILPAAPLTPWAPDRGKVRGWECHRTNAPGPTFYPTGGSFSVVKWGFVRKP